MGKERDIMTNILYAMRGLNKLEKDIDKIIIKVENGSHDPKEIVNELKKLKNKIWDLDE
jgi:archaellum component FlaC